MKTSTERRPSMADKPPLPPKPDDITSSERRPSTASGKTESSDHSRRRSSIASLTRIQDSAEDPAKKSTGGSTAGPSRKSSVTSATSEKPESSDDAGKSEQKKEHVVVEIEPKPSSTLQPAPAPARTPAVTPKKVVGGKWL